MTTYQIKFDECLARFSIGPAPDNGFAVYDSWNYGRCVSEWCSNKFDAQKEQYTLAGKAARLALMEAARVEREGAHPRLRRNGRTWWR